MSTLVATAGASNANSYLTVAEADAYFDDVYNRTGWTATGADAATKATALINATRMMDALFVWKNYPTHAETQALQWPRGGMLRRGGWVIIPDTEIPNELKWATAELARGLVNSDLAADSEVANQGLTDLTVGPISLSFKDQVSAKPVPDIVTNLIPREWGYLSTGRPVRPLYRA